MGRSSRKLNTQTIKLDREHVRNVWPLISPLLAEYHRRGEIAASHPVDEDYFKPFTLKTLVLSAYQQGLLDCMQLIESGCISIGPDGNVILKNTKGELL